MGPALSTEGNRGLLTALKTSRATGMPPTLYMGAWGRYGRVVPEWDDVLQAWVDTPMPQDQRTELDVRLEIGYQFYLDALCQKCGVPWWYGHSTDNRIQFEVNQTTCYGCAELERKEHQRSKKKSPGTDRFGVTDIVTPAGISFEAIGRHDPLPSPWEAMRRTE